MHRGLRMRRAHDGAAAAAAGAAGAPGPGAGRLLRPQPLRRYRDRLHHRTRADARELAAEPVLRRRVRGGGGGRLQLPGGGASADAQARRPRASPVPAPPAVTVALGSRIMSRMEGLSVELRMRLSAADAHYGGNLVDGAHGLEIFGDIVTELAIHTDGDEGLFAGYEKVEFLPPLPAGAFTRGRATSARRGTTSRTVALKLCREIGPRPQISDPAPDYLDEPVL